MSEALGRALPLLKFALVGVVNTLVYYAVFLLAHNFWPYLAAHLIAWSIGLVVSFLLNCWFTYRVRPTWRKFAMYPVTTLPGFVTSTVGLVALVEWLGVSERIAPLLASLIAMPAAYLLATLVLTAGHGDQSKRQSPETRPS